MDAFSRIAAAPPLLAAETVAEAVARQFGPRGELRPLVSERDQNFCLVTDDGSRFLVKVVGASEPAAATELQIRALQHLEQATDVIAPRVIPALDGRTCGCIDEGGASHPLRLLSWIEGELLEAHGIDGALATRLGQALGQLDDALADFEFEGENPVLLWDLQRIAELRSILGFIDDSRIRDSVVTAIDDYERVVAPVKADLSHQVIHADANPENVVVCDGGIGFIDFGDIVRAPRVFDPGIALSYLRRDGDDPLALVLPFMAGYNAVAAFAQSELDVLFDVVRARLATSITLLYWRLRDRPENDEYRRKSLLSESNASQFLAALDSTGRKQFISQISKL
jgi:Ser/Thr protein kinase RdoA (MazF antagonist)